MKNQITFNFLLISSKRIIIVLMMFFLINVVKSQTNYIENGKTYPVVKLFVNKYEFVKARNLTLINDSTIKYKNYVSGIDEVVSVKNVRFLSEKQGTYAVTYGAVGAGIGLLSAIYGISSVKSDPTLDDSGVNWAPFVLGFTAGGAALGAIIGACIPKWKRLYFNDSQTSYSLRVYPYVNMDYYGLGLAVNF